MSNKSNSIEECPLHNHSNCKKRPTTLKGPTRVIKLCVLGILLPTLLIAVPLYLRYHVYGNQLYPLAMSDMRLIDNKISTTWCQRQSVKVNTTFNAFLLSESPTLSPNLKPLTMVRHLVLEDDTKEYWGFYLLRGSSVTVSTCVRWPGASLIVIRGHKHLHECAYIGDNSSEELDELMEAIREGTYVATNDQNFTQKDDAPANEPSLMKRHRVEVEFHHPSHRDGNQNHTINNAIDTADITDSKMLKTILDALQEKTQKNKKKVDEQNHAHIHRNSTIAKGEDKNLKIEPPHPQQTKSQETFNDIVRKFHSLGAKQHAVLDELNKKFGNNQSKHQGEDEQMIQMKGRHYSKPSISFDDNIDKARRRRNIEFTNAVDPQTVEDDSENDFDDTIDKARRRRNIQFTNAVDPQMVEDDSENDLGVEEGFVPDGIADHRGTVNETTLNDYSNSEFWSSFSSSEEALLNCAGLILNLPLTPHHKCEAQLTEEQAEETYLANTITYKVPVNGYYFFVFNSENEVQPNYIRVQFHLNKAVYNVSDAIATCTNVSDSCAMDLRFFSSEKLVMELPVKENDSLWNEEFVVVSECEPRTALYVICVVAVPVLVMLFAFS